MAREAFEEMRSEEDIARAHDRLVAIILGEVPNPFFEEGEDGEARHMLITACDVLCWVLNHEHNHSFADNLKKIDRFLAARGMGLRRAAGCDRL